MCSCKRVLLGRLPEPDSLDWLAEFRAESERLCSVQLKEPMDAYFDLTIRVAKQNTGPLPPMATSLWSMYMQT